MLALAHVNHISSFTVEKRCLLPPPAWVLIKWFSPPSPKNISARGGSQKHPAVTVMSRAMSGLNFGLTWFHVKIEIFKTGTLRDHGITLDIPNVHLNYDLCHKIWLWNISGAHKLGSPFPIVSSIMISAVSIPLSQANFLPLWEQPLALSISCIKALT